jgi:DNA polymerase IV
VLGRARVGAELRDRARGIDNRRVQTSRERKSESCETTFAQDVSDREVMLATLDRLSARLCEGLQKGGYRGRTVTLKIRLRPFRTYTRSRTLEGATADVQTVRAVAHELLGRVELDAPVRLLGVGISALEKVDSDDTRLFAEA